MPHLMNNYSRLSIAFTHGQGSRLFDTEGKSYLDGVGGIAVNTLGHNHPRLTVALSQQIGRMIHVSNLYRVIEQEQLSDRLAAVSGMDEVFFCNSGCEANEAAIKLARLYGHNKGIDAPAIIVMEQAFHGRTLATLSATGNRKVQAGFEPLVSGFVRIPYDDIAAVEQVAANNPNVVAVLFEPVQGEGGIRAAHVDYIRALRRICDDRGWLLMADEVQCGVGRTGHWFAHQAAGVKVDVMALAKGLGAGVPIGACLTSGAATGVFKPGNHGSTFGGNPLACVAALTTLQVLDDDRLLQHVVTVGDALRAELRGQLDGVTGVTDIRGVGQMTGIELDRPCGELVALAQAKGLLINVTQERVIRLVPPLVLSAAEAKEMASILAPLIRGFLGA